MAMKSKKEYPFKVAAIIPKGSKIDNKNRNEALREKDAWNQAGITSKLITR